MINNRQNGRRRGRGGGPRSPNNAPNPGNRQDNRQRGNAAQLHEKYKAMARDAQLAGDRVQTEFYLQFADHYFRVLSEGRARFEEQRRPRDDFMSDEDEDQDEMAAQEGEREERGDYRGDRPQQGQREARPDRDQRPEREARPERDQRPDRELRNGGEQRPRRPRGDEETFGNEGQIALDSLPPPIAAVDAGEAKATRRRARRPRPEGGEAEIAPAA